MSCQNFRGGGGGKCGFIVKISQVSIYIIKGVMFVCHDLCSVWPAKRLGGLRPDLTHALVSTQGVFLARSMSRSFTYACRTDRSTKHPERCTKATPGERCSNCVRTTGEATPSERLRNSVWTTVITARVTRRATSAAGASRTPSGGRVLTASAL